MAPAALAPESQMLPSRAPKMVVPVPPAPASVTAANFSNPGIRPGPWAWLKLAPGAPNASKKGARDGRSGAASPGQA